MTTTLIEYGARVVDANGKADPAIPANKVKIPAAPRSIGKPVVSVDGVDIPHEAISAEAQQHPAASAAEAYREAARALVVRELLLAEARRLGLAAEPARDERGRRETDEDALISALLDREVKTPRADSAACRRHYDAYPSRFTSETIFEARHILIAAAPEDAEARPRAQSLAASLIAELEDDPSRFSALALEFSACPSKAQGGNLGQLTKGSTVVEFEAALARLGAGQLHPTPVASRFGYHVIRLDRVIPGDRLPFEVVEQKIAAYLEASSWSRAVSQYIGILAGKAEIRGIDIGGVQGALVQ
jgi:peptidyl-prolyl cis-trans isomerase C